MELEIFIVWFVVPKYNCSVNLTSASRDQWNGKCYLDNESGEHLSDKISIFSCLNNIMK